MRALLLASALLGLSHLGFAIPLDAPNAGAPHAAVMARDGDGDAVLQSEPTIVERTDEEPPALRRRVIGGNTTSGGTPPSVAVKMPADGSPFTYMVPATAGMQYTGFVTSTGPVQNFWVESRTDAQSTTGTILATSGFQTFERSISVKVTDPADSPFLVFSVRLPPGGSSGMSVAAWLQVVESPPPAAESSAVPARPMTPQSSFAEPPGTSRQHSSTLDLPGLPEDPNEGDESPTTQFEMTNVTNPFAAPEPVPLPASAPQPVPLPASASQPVPLPDSAPRPVPQSASAPQLLRPPVSDEPVLAPPALPPFSMPSPPARSVTFKLPPSTGRGPGSTTSTSTFIQGERVALVGIPASPQLQSYVRVPAQEGKLYSAFVQASGAITYLVAKGYASVTDEGDVDVDLSQYQSLNTEPWYLGAVEPGIAIANLQDIDPRGNPDIGFFVLMASPETYGRISVYERDAPTWPGDESD